jgi:hypothetical protein
LYGGRKLEIAPKRPLSSTKLYGICVTSGFRREKDENRVLPDYYAASIGNFFPTFRDNLSVSLFRSQEYETGNNIIHGFKGLNNS